MDNILLKLKKFFVFSGLFFFVCFCLGIGTLVYFSNNLPKISTLADYNPPIPSQIISKNGHILAEFGLEKRSVANFDEIPQVVVDALLSAEDANFYNHKGVDYAGIMRALFKDIKARKIVQGGSTITQQVAKSLLLDSSRSVTRKIKDILLAMRIEKKFSKQEILFLYLNQVYFGGGYYGIKVATKGYFGKELNEITIAEAALLAGLLVAPGKYSPYLNPQFAKVRQKYVLRWMLENGKITNQQHQDAIDEVIQLRLRKRQPKIAAYFVDWVRRRVINEVGEKNFFENGFVVKTTLDYELQKVAEREITRNAGAIDKRQGYKGPLAVGVDLEEYEIAFRKKMYKRASNILFFNSDGTSKYEIEFSEEEFHNIRSTKEELIVEAKSKYFMPGINPSDRLIKHIQYGKEYYAVVTKVNNYQRMIYLSIGGAPAVIPYEGYRWAHEREIQFERKYYPYVIYPSRIVKEGDKVLVKILKKPDRIWRRLNNTFKKNYKNKDVTKLIKKQKFFICMLHQKPDVQGALVSLLPKTGEIISLVGGTDFNISQFNRALQSKRQPGSAFKPFIYAAALENDFTPASIILDSPETLAGVDESLNWKPNNYDGKFKGPITVRQALEQSRNVPMIKVAEKIGIKVIKEFMKRIGLRGKFPNDLTISLGSFGVTLLNLVKVYSIFPNHGGVVNHKSIISVKDRYNNEYYISEELNEAKVVTEEEEKFSEEEFKIEDDLFAENIPLEKDVNPFVDNLTGDQVYDTRLAYIMTNLLKGVVQNPGGTGRSTKDVSAFIGGKTGTTNNFIDAWFAGFSANIATGVWSGFDENQTMGWAETGARAALPVWREYMRAAIAKYGEQEFRVPDGIIHVAIDKKTGRVDKKNKSFIEAFVDGRQPGIKKIENSFTNDEESQNSTLLEDDDYFTNQ